MQRNLEWIRIHVKDHATALKGIENTMKGQSSLPANALPDYNIPGFTFPVSVWNGRTAESGSAGLLQLEAALKDGRSKTRLVGLYALWFT